MKLTKEDIKKYGTKEDKDILINSIPNRKYLEEIAEQLEDKCVSFGENFDIDRAIPILNILYKKAYREGFNLGYDVGFNKL